MDDIVLSEIVKAHKSFSKTGGQLSEWYFLNKWRGGTGFPAGADVRLEILERLATNGRVERFEYRDNKDRPTTAIRPK